MSENESELMEMYVKFWEPYAVQMAARDVDVVKRVPDWLPTIDGMVAEQVSPYEMLLHRVPRARMLDVRERVKGGVVDDLGWKDEPSNVVDVGVVADESTDDARAEGLFFRKPRCMYTEKTPGFVRLDGCPSVAAMTDGTFRGGKVVLYLHGNGEDIFESREHLKPFMPPSCNLALVAYTGYGLSFGDAWECGCYSSAHRLYDWVHGELGYRPEDILVVGYSLGSAVALELAQTCASRALLLLAPFYSGRQALMDWYPGEAIDPQATYRPFPSDEMIRSVKCPIAVVHGEKDTACPCEHGRALYDLAPHKAGFTLVSEAGHCDLLSKLGTARFHEIVTGLLSASSA